MVAVFGDQASHQADRPLSAPPARAGVPCCREELRQRVPDLGLGDPVFRFGSANTSPRKGLIGWRPIVSGDTRWNAIEEQAGHQSALCPGEQSIATSATLASSWGSGLLDGLNRNRDELHGIGAQSLQCQRRIARAPPKDAHLSGVVCRGHDRLGWGLRQEMLAQQIGTQGPRCTGYRWRSNRAKLR